MNLQAKLTLGFVLLATVMVGLISAVDLGNNMQQQFQSTLERADQLQLIAAKFVSNTLNSPAADRAVPLREALRDPQLATDLLGLLTNAHAILEITVVDPSTNEILADSLPERVGEQAPKYPDFRHLVNDAGWYQKLQLLSRKDTETYQLQQSLGDVLGQKTLLYLRVIVTPALIRDAMIPSLRENSRVAIIFVIGAVCITFLFSAIAFRPLGRLRLQLEMVTRGDYEPQKASDGKPAKDEMSIMSSRVTLLSERLRGAQYEVSDLRGNIDRLLADLEDAVFIFNRERRLVFASGSVEKFLARQRTELPGHSIAEVFPSSTTLGLLVAQAEQTGRPVRNRRIPVAAPGEEAPGLAVVLLSVDMLEAVPAGAGAGSGLLVRLRDPEAQRKLGRELQTADRLAALSRISSGVAHEVKNPLNAILLHVEVARAKLAHGNTDVAQQMEIISREILRLDRVVKTLLDFTRPVELRLSTVSVGELMGEMVDLARPQADALRIRVNMLEDAEGASVRIDRDLLKQAVLNVVVNAMQAMPEGGELRLESLAKGDTAEIRISDTGCGIPPELRDKIFRLYFTTKKEGSGIGLAMTFRIVQLHDGTIDFTSEPGKGTTFFIRLPIAV
jgi:signal transduction histidine kinase